MSDEPTDEPTSRPTLGQVAILFLRLGATAMGGPPAHIALMDQEVVQRRRWITRSRFLDLLAAVHLIPGPNSTELAIHLGGLAGPLGMLVAGVCFIAPAAVLATALGWLFVSYRHLPATDGILYGVRPVLVAVIGQALVRFGRDSLKTPYLAVIAGLAVVSDSAGVDPLVTLLGGGMLAILPRLRPRTASMMAIAAVPAVPGGVAFGLGPLFLYFLKVGSILFGSGYVLLAFLRADLVERYGWLTDAELNAAIAVGQVTPGPLFTTATFIGYLLGDKFEVGGVLGAAVATVGIFLPAFVFVGLSGRLVPLVRRSAIAGAFLDGVVAASLALMLTVTIRLGREALIDPATVAILLAALLLLRGGVHSGWLVLAAAALGVGLT
jgi:chromate transporter